MSKAFTSFVVLAAMRTGSNYLEESLNRVAGLTCHGELFNPVFLAYPDQETLFGITMATRDRDPLPLLKLLRKQPGLNGFRYFPDHDPRVLDAILSDPSCAKIRLFRNPLDSYLSLKIARATGQWRLGGPGRRTMQVAFDGAEFCQHLDQLSTFQQTVERALQISGQTAFHLGYDDLGDRAVLAGLAGFLGLPLPAGFSPARKTLPQNPESAQEKVTNPAEMAKVLADLDAFSQSLAPNFEPHRGPGVPQFLVAMGAPVLFMPIPGGPLARIAQWLEVLGAGGGVQAGFTQSGLRDWMKKNPPFRSFTLLANPLCRAWSAYRRLFLTDADPVLAGQIARQFKVPRASADDMVAVRAGFYAFLGFLKANLNGQTALRIDPSWASQTATLQGFARFGQPDLLVREETLLADLQHLCATLGLACPDLPEPDDGTIPPAALCDDETQTLARQAYARDVLGFGFLPFNRVGS